MSKSLFQATLLASAVAFTSLSGAAFAYPGGYSCADKMAKFEAIHGFPYPGQATHKWQAQAEKPRLGVALSAIGQADLDALSLEYGVRIERVMPGSAAASAGLKPGDIVTAMGDRPAYSPERLQHLVSTADTETTVALTRDADTLKLPIRFADPSASSDNSRAALGIRIQNMTPDLKTAFGAADERGVLIAQVNDGSAAGKAGLKAGDVVVAVGDKDIQGTSDVTGALAAFAPGDEVGVTILRDRTESTLNIALDAAPQHSMTGRFPGWHGHAYPGHGKHGMYGHGYPGHGQHGHGYRWHQWHGQDPHGQGNWHGRFSPGADHDAPVRRPS
jgi:membrane-associated protease RseP (regulator of RpoE activity)